MSTELSQFTLKHTSSYFWLVRFVREFCLKNFPSTLWTWSPCNFSGNNMEHVRKWYVHVFLLHYNNKKWYRYQQQLVERPQK